MPEGPQVYRMAEKLREVTKNAVLRSFVSHESMVEDLHSRVTRIMTKGKRIIIVLDDGKGILIKFALTGKLEYGSTPVVSTSLLATMTMDTASGERLYVSLRDPQLLASAIFDRVSTLLTMLPSGFDPLHTITGMREWISLCRDHPGQLVANFITDQNIIAGIGNRYRSEIMHVAKIAPDARVRDLSLDQRQLLLISIYRVLKSASRGQYIFTVYGLHESIPEGLPVIRAEVAKGILVWTTAQTVVSARRAKNRSPKTECSSRDETFKKPQKLKNRDEIADSASEQIV